MATISSTTSYSASSGLSGLVSGLDTESMVQKLLSGTQARIDKQNADKQQIIWKQEMYRDVISTLKNFQISYFSFSKPENNLLSNTFFNSMSARHESSAIKANATSSAFEGKTTIEYIEKLASCRKEKASQSATAKITGAIDLNSLKREVEISVGDVKKTILLVGETDAQILDNLNQSLKNEFGEGVVSVSVFDGVLSITAADSEKNVVVTGSKLGLSLLGFSSSTIGRGAITGKIDSTKAVASVDITLDGIRKTIVLDGDAQDAETLVSSLQTSITKAFGSGITATLSPEGDRIEFDTQNYRQLTISGNAAGLSALGLSSGQSNTIKLGMQIKDINFSTKLYGSEFEFSINGTTITASADDTMASVIDNINASSAGVRVGYSAIDDKFWIESTTMGASITIDISQTSGNLLTALLGVKSGNGVFGTELYNNKLEGAAIDPGFSAESGQFKININGKTTTINLPTKQDGDGNTLSYTAQEAIEYINNSLKLGFGIDVDGNANVGISLEADKAIITSAEGFEVKFETGEITPLVTALGFSEGQNSIITEATSLSDLGIGGGTISVGGVSIDLGSLASVSELLGSIQTALSNLGAGGTVEFSKISKSFIIKNVSGDNIKIEGTDAAGRAALKKVFGADSVTLNSDAVAYGEVTEGSSAVLMVNGVLIERNTNNFSIGGLNIELLNTTKTDGSEKIDINVSRNTEQIESGIKSFIEDYNKLLDKLNSLISQDPEYKNYRPLTAQQKKEMSEKEIELWEQKAKTGLLKNDSLIKNILSEMRSVLYQKPEGGKYALYDLGVVTGGWQDKGKLVISDPEKLRNAIANDPSEIQRLFTDTDKGLSLRLNATIDSAVKSSSASPGNLVTIAGVKGMVSEKDNSLSKKINDIDNTVEKLMRTYEKEKARYWKQFNTMEELISNMNMQSQWLSMQFL